MYKYLVCLFISSQTKGQICLLADEVAKEIGVHPLYLWLDPHITFHRPIVADENLLKKRLANAVARARQSRITFSGDLDHFGKKYIVLPVQATWEIASLWVGIHTEFATGLPEYECGKYDSDNTLHVAITEVTEEIYDRVWPKIKKIRFEPTTIPFETISLYRKLVTGGKWENIASFPIPT